jgi:hypothetical protein
MLSITLIIFFSVVLFVYWFRYSCLLILQNRGAYSLSQASAAALAGPVVEERLKGKERGLELLDQLHTDLINDYRVVCFLVRCSSESGVDPIERRMLMMDYWIMRGWYSLVRRMAPPQARKALEEISNIVNYFSHSVGRSSTQQSEA